MRLSAFRKNVSKRNVVFHMLAVEAVMRGLAKLLGEDEDFWGLVVFCMA